MRQTVFRDNSQVLELKFLFFNGGNDEQRRALALCRAYETRYHLPVSVHLTALLVASIHADIPINDIYAIRLGYSAALIRVVNEVLDSAQVGKVAAPLHALAKILELPNTFVELRHAATHETLPSIDLLRELSQRALKWIFDKYWSLQVAPAKIPRETDPKKTFSAWRRVRRTRIMNQPLDPLTSDEKELVHTLSEQFNNDPIAFMKVLFEKNILVPTELQPSNYIRKGELAVIMWGPAFVDLGPGFLEQLCTEVCQTLNNKDWDPVTCSVSKKSSVLIGWLEFAIGNLQTPSDKLFALLSSIPRTWNMRGLSAYYKRFEDIQAYKRAQKMATFLKQDLDLPEIAVTSTTNLKWNRVRRWTPKPIGT